MGIETIDRVKRALAGAVLALSAAAYMAVQGMFIGVIVLLRPGFPASIRIWGVLILYAVAALMCLLSVIRYRRGAWIVCAGVAAMAASSLALHGGPQKVVNSGWLTAMEAALLRLPVGGAPVMLCGLWWGRYVKRRGGVGRVPASLPFFRGRKESEEEE